MPDDVLLIEHPNGDETVSNHTEQGNLTIAMTAMANSAAAANSRRVDRFDQLGADSAAMWGIAMTSPTFMAAQGQRLAQEAGSGRTRVEANTPAASQTTG
jgi:Tfp pilus assembly protein FimT